ncbi:putative adenylyltransferase/sulfurtransferase MoeZ [Caulifigura coniformis]|uniref:tRNA uridine(34) hydroxylase n=1 Tax=Caulifigura coniformis TaxID=2527983 RepID=A0A517SFN2_9PLAN|nr:rhodanese-like domain-containing protein [Caulifigura coniformis]QDT54900.1 putative adenylyltransferase/sulfurtransferase MoeZ [Caulifigura coniformis]
MKSVLNIAAYRFAPLQALKELQAGLRELCTSLEIRGTILLAPEGINLFLAGSHPALETVLARLRTIEGLEGLTAKESFSARQPFRKLLVKIKKEIITFGRPEARPDQDGGRRIGPAELKRWLDEGREVTLLDTRNTYEVEVGTFRNAIAPPLQDFSRFPELVAQLPEELKEKPIVTFCTGGIRCEKAAPWMEMAGFQNVLQLDGGILKYFEECGGAHFEGNCFVFDLRTAVTPELTPVVDEIAAAVPEINPNAASSTAAPACRALANAAPGD